jgi:poly(3-hydroxybutyrate) depolymerase
MRDAGVFFIASLGLVLAGCPVTQPQNTPVPEKLITDPVTGGGYFLYVSTAYNRNKPAPLIVSCHGTVPFDPAESQVRELKMLAEQHGCVLVCPKLASTDGILGSGSIAALLRDEKLIMSIVGNLHYMYNIDRHNILITGFSGGGFPAYFVGLRHPDTPWKTGIRRRPWRRRSRCTGAKSTPPPSGRSRARRWITCGRPASRSRRKRSPAPATTATRRS